MKKETKKAILSALVLALTLILMTLLVACGGGATTPAPATPAPAADGNATATNPAPEAPANTDPIIIVYYPNESAAVYQDARDEIERIIHEATGRPVQSMLTTDYVITIEAISSGTATIAYLGATGYIEARNRSASVEPLVVNTGPSGTLEDALYFSWFAVNYEDADSFRGADGEFDFSLIEGRRMSFVSPTSTSGFVVPMGAIEGHFGTDRITDDYVIEGDFFSELLFGQSHQGALFNLIDGRVDVATVADTVFFPGYVELVSGELNTVGSVYAIREGAEAPFHNSVGQRIILMASVPVLNPPWAINTDFFTPEEIQAIRDALTSEESANNYLLFTPADMEGVLGWNRKTGDERFVEVDDAWFNPLRRG